MLERYPDEAPPSLVIVVDEFATLVKEVPDFVAGVVDIAQRGRSLGVHLILATQRPSGSVNENILANTNLRISLRMLDGMESKTIIGVGSAADIPLPLKGRGFAKLGPRDLIEFQSAFTGAQLTQENEVIPVVVEPFGSMARPAGGPTTASGRTTSRRSPHHGRDDAGCARSTYTDESSATLAPPVGLPMPPTSLRAAPAGSSVVLAATAVRHRPPLPSRLDWLRPRHRSRAGRRDDASRPAARRRSLGDAELPRRASRGGKMLPEMLEWDTIDPPVVTNAVAAGRFITLGMLDDPAAQAQYPAVFDLEEGGGLLIAGGGGSGKTTALRTVARSAVDGATPDEVALFVIDCASRSLGPLRDLPHCAAVATGDDLESITRVIVMLTAELDRRRALLSLSTFRRKRCRRTSTRGTRCRGSSCSSTATRTSTRSSAPSSRWRSDRSTGSPSCIASSPTDGSSESTSSSPPIAARRCRR